MWVARDIDGSLQIFNQLPVREGDLGIWNVNPTAHLYNNVSFLSPEFFPSLDWEDDPIRVLISRKTNVLKKKQIDAERAVLWAARDIDDALYIYSHKPTRLRQGFWDLPDPDMNNVTNTILEVEMELLPNLKWENEPVKIELVRCG